MIRLGFEYGPGGNKNGTREFRERLNAAGIGVCFKGTDDAGLIFEAQEETSTVVDNTLIYRVSTAGQNDGRSYDVPDYTLAPLVSAQNHLTITMAKWPIELNPARVFSEPINEPRAKPDPNKPNYNNMHPCDWLGHFMTEYAIMANAAGFKVCGPGFNAGEPGDDGKGIADAVTQYSQPGMLRWLAYCAANPTMAALSVHEYTQDLLPYANSYPHKLGRFQAAIAAADLAGIPRTFPIFITEFGWTLNEVPSWEAAVPTLQAYAELSARFPQLEAAAIWSLRSGWKDIDKELAAYISDNGNPLANWLINNNYPADPQPQPTAPEFGGTLPIPDAPEEPMTKKWIMATRHMTEEIKPTHARIAFFKKGTDGGGGDVYIGKTDDFELPDGATVVSLVLLREEPDEPTDPKPPAVDPSVFNVQAWPTDYKVVTQTFGNNPDYYGQFDLPGHEGLDMRAPTGSPIYAISDGTVYEVVPAEDGHNYGIRVRIRSGSFRHIYAHLQETAVAVGDIVAAGQHIGLADNTGNSFGSHLHLTLKNDNAVPGDPQYIGYPYNIIDPTPFLAPFNPEWPGTPPPPPTGQTYDTSFMRAEPGIWRVIRRADGSGEDVWELPLDSQNDVRVKNTNQGEWYFYGNGGVYRKRDTSPAPQSDGTERLYLLNDGAGGQIAPNEATVGVTYSYTNQVQFKAKSNCADLAENSGTAVSTFLLKEVIQNYTFPATGFTVDWLYVTEQTGETQLYAVHDGRRYGWVGGGASQDNNVWGGQLNEVYYDRAIPPGEPPTYCS